jgi:hypothetical protein
MRAQLLHLSGADRGRTVTYEGARRHDRGVTIEPRPCSRRPAIADRHAQIELVEDECRFHLRRLDGQVFVNGAEVEEVILQDGDRLEFGAGGPMARFRIYVPLGAVCKPVHRMPLGRARRRPREWRRCGDEDVHARPAHAGDDETQDHRAAHARRGRVPRGWLGGWIGRAATLDLVTRKDFERLRELQQTNAVTQAQLEALRQDQQKQQQEIATLARANSGVLQIQKVWSRGVCLVQGSTGCVMPDQSWFSLDNTEPFECEYTGSGFLASAAGYVITNRHVVAPWTEAAGISALIEQGREARVPASDGDLSGVTIRSTCCRLRSGAAATTATSRSCRSIRRASKACRSCRCS